MIYDFEILSKCLLPEFHLYFWLAQVLSTRTKLILYCHYECSEAKRSSRKSQAFGIASLRMSFHTFGTDILRSHSFATSNAMTKIILYTDLDETRIAS